MIDHTVLVDMLQYEPSSGHFQWKIDRPGGVRAGSRTGRVDSRGYLQVCVMGRRYGAHRLAWFWQHGVWPPEEIDHINGDRTDNRLINLRCASRTENQRNKRFSRVASTGVVGVRRHSAGKWEVHAGPAYIGIFHDFDVAVAARNRAVREMGFHPNHGKL